MFKNPLKKYQQGGQVSQEQQQMLAAFVEWLPKRVKEFQGMQPEQIVEALNGMTKSPEGQKQVRESILYYQENAHIIAQTLTDLNIPFTGGINSPYIWFKCPFEMDSWSFFDKMLEEIAVVGTPGAGFGKNGVNWFRLTAFGDKDDTIEAMQRLRSMVK